LVDKCIRMVVFIGFVLETAVKGIILVCALLRSLSAYIAFDDLFCFHEILAPRYLEIPEKLVYIFLAAVTIIYLLLFRKLIFKPDGVLSCLLFPF
jgi:hypothetical protein